MLKTGEVGILGGGQLARMLAESASRLGLKPIVYSESADCPAKTVAADVVVGTLSDRESLSAFLRRFPVVAFENEFVDCTRLAEASQDSKQFAPSLDAIRILQDKLQQKHLLKKARVPTSTFVELDSSKKNFMAEILSAREKIGAPGIVLKWSRLGYDGKGVFVVGDKRMEEAVRFCEQAAARSIPIYAEKRIDFKRELAIVAVASRDGRTVVSYPLVVSEQKNGICHRVYGPACKMGVRKSLQAAAERAARQVAKATGIFGTFALEFFESKKGELLVNEIAPRVHNTGHYTQNAFGASQFDNHWRALMGFTLDDPRTEPQANRRFFAMLNLLGPEGLSIQANGGLPLPQPPASGYLHWYDKTELRPGRKLGHLNGIASSPTSIRALLKKLEKCEKDWINQLTKESRR